ncbi:MAG TPA: GAF domain-containing protein [Ktedonobacteraceae bacterium]
MSTRPTNSAHANEPALTTQAWRSVLQRIIAVSSERHRLATAMSVTPMTLSRWANDNSTPAKTQLIRLLQMVPSEHRAELIEALAQDYTDIHHWLHDEIPEQIPTGFFSQILNIRATVKDSLRFWQISEMVLKQALAQLDTNRLGVSITLVQCMPPYQKGKIRSLRERVGKGTSPWPADLEHLSVFLGIESLAGYVVQSHRPSNIDDLNKDHLLPAYQTEFEISAAAHPILLEGRIAGCLLASSTQIGYFTPQHLALLGTFSDIISLAFNKEEFYPTELVELHIMPRAPKQRPYLGSFRQMVTQTIIKAAYNHQHIDNFEAERMVWQEMEELLLSLPGLD